MQTLNHKDFIAKKNKNSGPSYIGRDGVRRDAIAPPSEVLSSLWKIFTEFKSQINSKGKICVGESLWKLQKTRMSNIV